MIWPRELPCPKCDHPTSLGAYEEKDFYHCVACNADIGGNEYRNWKWFKSKLDRNASKK